MSDWGVSSEIFCLEGLTNKSTSIVIEIIK